MCQTAFQRPTKFKTDSNDFSTFPHFYDPPKHESQRNLCIGFRRRRMQSWPQVENQNFHRASGCSHVHQLLLTPAIHLDPALPVHGCSHSIPVLQLEVGTRLQGISKSRYYLAASATKVLQIPPPNGRTSDRSSPPTIQH